MNQLTYILAAGDDSWVEIVGIVIFIGLGIIGSLFQKDKAKKQKEEEARKARKKSEPSGRRQRQARSPRAAQPTQPAPPTTPQPEQTVRVSDELRSRQQRQAQLERDREKRLDARVSPESDTDAIEARLVSVRSSEADTAPGQISEAEVIPSLKTLADARKAMILHEIFSPPKALRQGGETWDT